MTTHLISGVVVRTTAFKYTQDGEDFYKFYDLEQNTISCTASDTFRLLVQGATDIEYESDNEHSIKANISSLIRVSENVRLSIYIYGEWHELDLDFGKMHGLRPETIANIITKPLMRCDGDELPIIQEIVLPDTIYQPYFRSLAYYYNGMRGSVTGGALANQTLQIQDTSQISIRDTDSNIVLLRKFRKLQDDVRYAYLEWNTNIAQSVSRGYSINNNYSVKMGAVFELREWNITANSEVLDTNDSGQDVYFHGYSATAKLGITDCTDYDVAYYSAMLLSASGAVLSLFDGGILEEYQVSVKTDKATLRNSVGRKNFEIEINVLRNEN